MIDDNKKEELIEMLVANSSPIRSIEDTIGSGKADSTDFSTSNRKSLSRMKYNYAMQRLITNYFNYNSLQVTVYDIQKSVMAALIDLAGNPLVVKRFTEKETSQSSDKSTERPDPTYPVEKTVEDDGLVEVFSAKMGAIKRDLGKAQPREFTIWFPWHVRWGDDPPEFKIYGHTFRSAEKSEWRPYLEKIAEAPDVSGGEKILREIEEGNYDIWRTDVSGRTVRWAMIQFKNALEILSAQLNHSACFIDYQTRADRLGRLSGETIDSGRWTAIQRPFGVFHVDEYVDDESFHPHWGANIYNPGGRSEIKLDFSSLSERFDTHPAFEDIQVNEEPLLHDALVDYQQGLTETNHRRSFINFWRVIEDLALAEQEKKEVTVERALLALELVTEGDYDPFFQQVANEIWGVRNTRIHETGWNRIGTEHEIVTKVLADAMIELYITEFADSNGAVNKSETRRVFKWATKTQESREETQEALKTIHQLIEDE